MANIFPFRGIRYNPSKVSFADVVTPPYDVISSADQKKLYEKSAYNLVRLEYGYEYADDRSGNNRYTRAAATFQEWLENEILIQDNKPAYYWYQQQFPWQGDTYTREGLIATLQTEPYEKGNILPHEETLSKPKEDRLKLLEHCKANFSPIFGLYPDAEGLLEKECFHVKKNTPMIDFTDDENQSHRVWLIDDPRLHQRLEDIFASWFIFLADGHHRYETALLFAQMTGYDRILIFLFNFYSPSLLILPTHRVINNLPGTIPSRFFSKLRDHFTIEQFGPASKSNLPGFIDYLKENNSDNYLIGLCLEDNLYYLKPDNPGVEAKHDVDIFQKLILEKTLRITPEELREGGILTYTRSEEEALDLVCNEKAQASFFLNPPSKEMIMASAKEGKRLPQKSTYFYPKLVSGLVLNKLD